MQYILVTYTCKPGQRQAFLDALNGEGLAAKCRAEDGNIKYDYYFPENGNENELFLREIWQSAEALKAHMEMPHFKRIGEVKSLYVDDTEIIKLEG
ncbi:MAG: antibiotic biosynthesis monooxygenase [Firmicutes bacterium]|nr:antibiotic biosynthesis monooxygenase [Bacillota bacterium]